MSQLNNKVDNDAFGAIFLEFYRKQGPGYYFIERDDGLLSYRTTEPYFQKFNQWSKEEQNLIQTIFQYEFRSVLDIGSGAGRVSLYLQEKGLDILALDISAGSIEVCQLQGIRKFFQGDIFNYHTLEPFDCVLLLGNNLGIGGDYDGTKKLLNKCKELTKNGHIFLHYVSPIPTEDSDHVKYHKLNESGGKRIGEITLRIRYRTLQSDWFKLFLPTEEEFNKIIDDTGLEIVRKWMLSKNSFYVHLAKKS